jgi:hypothetical protein
LKWKSLFCEEYKLWNSIQFSPFYLSLSLIKIFSAPCIRTGMYYIIISFFFFFFFFFLLCSY